MAKSIIEYLDPDEGVLGLGISGDNVGRVFGGYDSSDIEYKLGPADRVALAKEMIARWQAYAAEYQCATCAGTGEPLEAHEADTETKCHMCDGTGLAT